MKNNIQVDVKVKYLAKESNTKMQYFVFSYTITITNKGEVSARLLDRHWVITDDTNKVEEVMGEGVVGEQPYLESNNSYTYTSGVVLGTPTGTMKGTYGMLSDDGDTFLAIIPEFALIGPVTIH